jgi:hypothetical protein
MSRLLKDMRSFVAEITAEAFRECQFLAGSAFKRLEMSSLDPDNIPLANGKARGYTSTCRKNRRRRQVHPIESHADRGGSSCRVCR